MGESGQQHTFSQIWSKISIPSVTFFKVLSISDWSFRFAPITVQSELRAYRRLPTASCSVPQQPQTDNTAMLRLIHRQDLAVTRPSNYAVGPLYSFRHQNTTKPVLCQTISLVPNGRGMEGDVPQQGTPMVRHDLRDDYPVMITQVLPGRSKVERDLFLAGCALFTYYPAAPRGHWASLFPL